VSEDQVARPHVYPTSRTQDRTALKSTKCCILL
jgi:hypothetical protein